MLKTIKSLFSSRRLPQYGTAIIANIAVLSYGVLQGWASPSLPLLRANETAVGVEPMTEGQESWIGSLTFLGALLTSPLYSYVNQNLGRKAAGYLTAIPLVVGWLMIIFTDSVMIICAARFIHGFSMAGVNIFVTMYVGEITEDGMRGALGNFRGVTNDLGIIIIYLVAPSLSIQMTAIIFTSLPLLFLLTYFWLPESPMFLLWKGKDEEARKAYLWLRGGDEQVAEEEMTKLKAVMKDIESTNNKMTLKQILSVRGTRKALLIAFVLATAQQFSGMNAVFGYFETILEMTGSTLSPQLASIIFSVINICGPLFSCFCSDLVGRRFILITTQLLQTLCLAGFGAYLTARKLGVDVSGVGNLPVFCLSLYCLCVEAGTGNLIYVVVSEIFRPEARGLAMHVSSYTAWILAFLSTYFFSTMVDQMGADGCFFLFAAVSFAGAIFVYFKLPETKNRSLKTILQKLDGRSSSTEDKVEPA